LRVPKAEGILKLILRVAEGWKLEQRLEPQDSSDSPDLVVPFVELLRAVVW
jgi:hypothetical protein